MKRTVTLQMPVEVELDLELDGCKFKVLEATATHVISRVNSDSVIEQLNQISSGERLKHYDSFKSLATTYMSDLLKEVGEVIHFAYKGDEIVCGSNSTRYTNDSIWLFHLFKGCGACQDCLDYVDRALRQYGESKKS